MTSLHLCDSVGSEDLFCDDNWQSFFKRKKAKMPKIEIDAKRCKGCGFCVKFCPKNLIQLDSNFNDKGYHPAVFKNQGDCTGCGLCALVCPDVSITVYK